MGQLPQLQQARRRVGLALDSICHDRWVLGYLRAGWLQPIAASEVSRRFLQGRPLMPLGRRALFEKRPMVMNAVIENPNPSLGYDWELDWPALLYAPVGEVGSRALVEGVIRKLRGVSADEFALPLADMRAHRRSFRL